MSDLKTTKIVFDNVGRQPLPLMTTEYVEKNYIHKDKIRERIKELENSIDNFTYRNLTGKDIRGVVIRELKSILKEE